MNLLENEKILSGQTLLKVMCPDTLALSSMQAPGVPAKGMYSGDIDKASSLQKPGPRKGSHCMKQGNNPTLKKEILKLFIIAVTHLS